MTEKPTAAAKPEENWDDAPEAPVKVRCIVHTRPHAHKAQGALVHGKEYELPADVAKLMLSRKQVELVG